jgi:hypothetical protein
MKNKKEGKKLLPKDNKGQELSTTTIILIILGVAILVILIIGFTTGWSFFNNILKPTNVDSVVQDCQSACGTNQKFSFCSADRTLRVNEEKLEVKTSCYVMANAASFVKYSIEKCPAIDCNLACDQVMINGKKASLADSAEGAKYDFTSIVTVEEGKNCIIN